MPATRVTALLAFVSCLASAVPAAAAPIQIGQIDTFEDGTTANWAINLLGFGNPPPAALPQNISTGGPGGVDDNYLQLTAIGGSSGGGRLVALNPAQWAGDYLAGGVTGIEMDVRNLGQADLFLRLLFEDPQGGPPQNVAISSNAIFLPAGGNWTSVVFPILPGALTALNGDVNAALSGATILRIFSSQAPIFPPDPIVAQLGVDNITAAGSVPEPASLRLFGSGLGLAAWKRRRAGRRSA